MLPYTLEIVAPIIGAVFFGIIIFAFGFKWKYSDVQLEKIDNVKKSKQKRTKDTQIRNTKANGLSAQSKTTGGKDSKKPTKAIVPKQQKIVDTPPSKLKIEKKPDNLTTASSQPTIQSPPPAKKYLPKKKKQKAEKVEASHGVNIDVDDMVELLTPTQPRNKREATKKETQIKMSATNEEAEEGEWKKITSKKDKKKELKTTTVPKSDHMIENVSDSINKQNFIGLRSDLALNMPLNVGGSIIDEDMLPLSSASSSVKRKSLEGESGGGQVPCGIFAGVDEEIGGGGGGHLLTNTISCSNSLSSSTAISSDWEVVGSRGGNHFEENLHSIDNNSSSPGFMQNNSSSSSSSLSSSKRLSNDFSHDLTIFEVTTDENWNDGVGADTEENWTNDEFNASSFGIHSTHDYPFKEKFMDEVEAKRIRKDNMCFDIDAGLNKLKMLNTAASNVPLISIHNKS